MFILTLFTSLICVLSCMYNNSNYDQVKLRVFLNPLYAVVYIMSRVNELREGQYKALKVVH